MKHPFKNFQVAAIATDVVIFTVNEQLNVLLIKMKRAPFTGHWAIPGGMVKVDESVDNAAKRHLLSKTGVTNIYLEQLYTFGDVDRDPYGRVVSVAYMALIPEQGLKLKTSEDYSDIDWFPANQLPKMAYDHKEIVNFAVQRLKAKLEYTNIVYSLMPEEFTLGDLQNTYELILKTKLDKRNFRKKIIALKIVKPAGKRTVGDANRPAELYRFVSRKPQIVEII